MQDLGEPRTLHMSVVLLEESCGWARVDPQALNHAARARFEREAHSVAAPAGICITFHAFPGRQDEPPHAFRKRVSDFLSGGQTGPVDRASLACLVFAAGRPLADDADPACHDLARDAKRLCPSVARLLLAKGGPPEQAALPAQLYDHVVAASSMPDARECGELVESACHVLFDRLAAPYWSALKAFASDERKIVLHALANADNRTRCLSVTLDDFADFFGQNYFRAEASATSEPLDSLFRPRGSLLQAQVAYARSFGADRALFVTGGTTAANKIVHQGLCHAGAIVILDRFCHISHHYACALGRSSPDYVNARFNPELGIPSQVRTSDVAGKIREHLERGTIPALVALTNCTFDGLMLEPGAIFIRTREVFRELGREQDFVKLAFLFDEAWFAFARFHPAYVRFSALSAKEALVEEDDWWRANLRVYVTHSAHKTLSSFRQAAAVLASDPVLAGLHGELARLSILAKLEGAYTSHSTTSPNSGMLASLDVGRRQIAIEGYCLIQGGLDVAADFRSFIDAIGQEFETANGEPAISALGPHDLISEREEAETCRLDVTKVTIQASGWITGSEFRLRLWRDHRIQVNKFADNSVLCMLSIGVGRQMLPGMKREFRRFLTNHRDEIASYRRGHATERRSPAFPQLVLFADPRQAGRDADACSRPPARDPGRYLMGASELYPALLSVSPSGVCQCRAGYVAASFIVPYPPGYPVLIPGQVVTPAVLEWLMAQGQREIHGLLDTGRERCVPAFKL